MKIVPAGFVNFLRQNQQMLIAELFYFEFRDGNFAFYTNLDIDIVYGGGGSGNRYTSQELLIEGMRFKQAVGFAVDEQDVKISAYPDALLAGADFFKGVAQGLLDGAKLTRQRGYWAISDGRPWVDYRAPPQAVVVLFSGLVSQITKLGSSTCELKVKSPLKLLDIEMPRNTFQPMCGWTLYDAHTCTVNRTSFTNSFTVDTADGSTVTPVGGVSPNVGADSAPYYMQGRLLFTSGALANEQFIVGGNDATKFYLTYPLTDPPAPGDTFDVSAGCLKRNDTCQLKFNILQNFRGFPKVPPIHISA